MIPLWKFKRELGRFGQQLRAIPEALWEPFAQRAHDRQAAKGFPLAQGAVPAGPKIAVILTYQPDRMAASLPVMCDHLRAKGYAPFVVANAPLGENDREALLPHVWRIMERPNFGYDFGGYRDALRHLRTQAGIEKVLILNDSIWFPLYSGEDLIARLEAADADVAGTILRERGEERFLESYCYLIGAHVLNDPKMRAFWDGLKLTSNKYKVIRRGERQHSAALLSAGFRLQGVYDRAEFLGMLKTQDDAFLRKMLIYSAFHDERVSAERDRLLATPDGPGWRAEAWAFIETAQNHGQFYSQFPFATAHLLSYPLLKKSGDRPITFWREAFVAGVQAGDIPVPDEPFWSEIRARAGTGPAE